MGRCIIPPRERCIPRILLLHRVDYFQYRARRLAKSTSMAVISADLQEIQSNFLSIAG